MYFSCRGCPMKAKIAYNSEQLVLKYNPHWSAHSMKRYVIGKEDWELRAITPKHWGELFELEVAETFDLSLIFTRES